MYTRCTHCGLISHWSYNPTRDAWGCDECHQKWIDDIEIVRANNTRRALSQFTEPSNGLFVREWRDNG